jgi:hypothetical protein
LENGTAGMSLPRNITFIVKGGKLCPYYSADRMLFDERYGDGEIVESDVPALMKKYFAILSRVIKERSPSFPYDSVEELSEALKLAAGAVYASETLAGKPFLAVYSVSAIKDFPAFFDNATGLLADYLGISLADLLKDPRQEEMPPPPPPKLVIEDKQGSQEAALEKMRDKPPVPLAWEYSRQACVQKMLELANNREFLATPMNREKLEDIVAMWRDYVGDFADRCGTIAWDIIARNIAWSAGKRLMETELDKNDADTIL